MALYRADRKVSRRWRLRPRSKRVCHQLYLDLEQTEPTPLATPAGGCLLLPPTDSQIINLMPPSNDETAKLDADLAVSVLLSLIEDYHDFNPDTVVPVYSYPTHVQFSQQVSRGRPCVYRLDRSVLDTETASEATPKGVKHTERTEQQRQKPSQSVEHEHLRNEQRVILTAPCFRWTKRRLCELVDGEVEVAVTPDGRADSLYALPNHDSRQRYASGLGCRDTGEGPNDTSEQVFLQPATTHMTVSNLLDELCPQQATCLSPGPPTKPVYYLQSQDSNLSRPELSSLVTQLPATPPPFALPTLGEPEATNIWIGNAQSVTSTHRDPYENLYLVVKGRKKFVLYSPVEEICLHAQMVRTGKWTYDEESGKFDVAMDSESPNEDPADDDDESTDSAVDESNNGLSRIPWIPIDPLNLPPSPSTKYPYYRHARPLTVTVDEGEILYLPAGWFHHVSQECGKWADEDGNLTVAPCIAVNYWFDMDYSGEKHVMREMVGRLVEKVRLGQEVAR